MSFTFLLCPERSGSNLITQMMNSHPDICGPSAKHLFNPITRNLFRYGNLEKEQNWESLLIDVERLMNVNFSIWKSKFDLLKLKKISENRKVDTLLKNIYLEEAKANNKTHLFIKENHVYEFFPFLLYYFPEANYLYLIRDPRDMALSWKKYDALKGGIVTAAKHWKNDQINNLKNYYLLKLHNKAMLIKYEDLISDTVNCGNKICKFIGVEYSDKILDFYLNDLTKQNADKQVAWENLKKKVMPNNKDKFKKELTDIEIKIIEKICYYEMHFFGYTPINSHEELEALSENEIISYETDEFKNLNYKLSNGIIDNIDAKRYFYNKMILE